MTLCKEVEIYHLRNQVLIYILQTYANYQAFWGYYV